MFCAGGSAAITVTGADASVAGKVQRVPGQEEGGERLEEDLDRG